METEKIIREIFSLDLKAMELQNQLDNVTSDRKNSIQELVTRDLDEQGYISANTELILSTFAYEVAPSGEIVAWEREGLKVSNREELQYMTNEFVNSYVGYRFSVEQLDQIIDSFEKDNVFTDNVSFNNWLKEKGVEVISAINLNNNEIVDNLTDALNAQYQSTRYASVGAREAAEKELNKRNEAMENIQNRMNDSHPKEEHYKGYAYIKGQSKATIVYANNTDEILTKLRSWNKARPENSQFNVVNIGSLNRDNKYEDFHKYEIVTGKDISSIYLTIPPMDKGKFKETIQQFKANGAKYIPSKKQWYITADMNPAPFKDFLDNGDIQLARDLRPAEDSKEYALSLSKNIEENICTVYFTDGREPIQLFGDQFGVNFSQLNSAAEAVDIVGDFIQKQLQNDSVEINLKELMPGSHLECYVPVFSSDGRVEAVSPLSATINAVTDNSYKLADCSIKEYASGMSKDIVFSKAQAEVLNRALRGHSSEEVFSMMMNSSRTPAMMDVIRAAEQDGLTVQQIQTFSEKGYDAAEMDFHRIGLQNGVTAEKIHAISTADNTSWADKRNLLSMEIRSKEESIGRDFKREGYPINRFTARKINQLNHLTHKTNTTADIADAFCNKTYSSNSKVQELVNDVAKEFQVLEISRNERQV